GASVPVLPWRLSIHARSCATLIPATVRSKRKDGRQNPSLATGARPVRPRGRSVATKKLTSTASSRAGRKAEQKAKGAEAKAAAEKLATQAAAKSAGKATKAGAVAKTAGKAASKASVKPAATKAASKPAAKSASKPATTSTARSAATKSATAKPAAKATAKSTTKAATAKAATKSTTTAGKSTTAPTARTPAAKTTSAAKTTTAAKTTAAKAAATKPSATKAAATKPTAKAPAAKAATRTAAKGTAAKATAAKSEPRTTKATAAKATTAKATAGKAAGTKAAAKAPAAKAAGKPGRPRKGAAKKATVSADEVDRLEEAFNHDRSALRVADPDFVEADGEDDDFVDAPPVQEVRKPATRGRRSARGREKALLREFGGKPNISDADRESTRKNLRVLIKMGKERNYLTYAEINDHLPEDLNDPESLDSIIQTFSDMGIQVYEQAPDAETLLMSDSTPVNSSDDDAEEEAEAALSTVDSEFGRTTDPVRMYMREMGSVELLTREGEIEIAKRIESGLKHMIGAISACPTTIAEVLADVAKIRAGEMRIDELVDGLLDDNAEEDLEFGPKNVETDEDDDGESLKAAQNQRLAELKAAAMVKFD